MKQGCRRRIGNGEGTEIWSVPWLPCIQNGYLTTVMYEELEHENVQSLMNEDGMGWDVEIVQDICNERDRQLIQQIPIPYRNKVDSWYWILEDTGEFSVKSGYRYLRGEAECVNGSFWQKLWRMKLPGKVLNLSWCTSRGVLPTAAALRNKRVNVDVVYTWCRDQVETDIHVLFKCPFAKEIWLTMGLQNIVLADSADTVITILMRAFELSNEQQCRLVALLCWCLWNRKKKWVWTKTKTSVFGTKSFALNMLADWDKSCSEEKQNQVRSQQSNKHWCKPPTGWVKINVDAACREGTCQIGVACVVRDEHGKFLRVRVNLIQGRAYAREAEALSLKEALSWVKDWRVDKCIFESDAKLLVDAFSGRQGRSFFDTIVDDCRELLKHFVEVSIVFVHRYANSVAHALAQATYSLSGLKEWYSVAPDFILCNLAL